MRRVEIEWVDSQRCSAGWDGPEAYRSDFADMLKPDRHVRSCGYLLDENEQWVALVQSCGHDQVADAIFIPKRAIVRTIDLGASGA